MLKLTKQNKLELFWTVCSTAQHSSGYKPIFLDSMELVAIEQARRLVYSARAAYSVHTEKRARSPPPRQRRMRLRLLSLWCSKC